MGAYYKGTWGASSATGYHATEEVVREGAVLACAAQARGKEVGRDAQRDSGAMMVLSMLAAAAPALRRRSFPEPERELVTPTPGATEGLGGK